LPPGRVRIDLELRTEEHAVRVEALCEDARSEPSWPLVQATTKPLPPPSTLGADWSPEVYVLTRNSLPG
jgi:hypothetical protein